MARATLPLRWFLGLGAVLFGIAALFLEPFRVFLSEKTAEYGVSLPLGLSLSLNLSPPTVFDAARDIRYIGSRSSYSVEHFQNIFYAEDTSGANRFAPPVPTVPPKGSTIDATRLGAWCLQGTGDIFPFTSRVTNVSENCLSLRIARPRGTQPGAKLPVVVWLHGGGHALGSAQDVLYEPDGLIKEASGSGQPLIFVGINYRLGLFGFATSQALIKAKHTNVGLRDQRAAFEWVRDNIGIFGGDPQRVTALGQSVGASDISLQLTAFGGEKGVPFQRAIMMSGAPGLNFNTKSDLVANNTAAVAQEIGCVQNGDSQSEQTLQCLRDALPDVLANLSVTTARAARPPFGEAFFYPTYDGDFLPDRPSELVRAGRVNKGVPVIASWVTNDGAWYASPATSTDEDVLASFGLWLTGHSEETKARLLQLYPPSDFEHMAAAAGGAVSAQYYRAAQLNRDLWFTCPVLDFAWQYGRRHNGGQVRLYEHNATRFSPVFEAIGVPMWRVAHLSDIPYVLNAQALRGGGDNSAAQLALSRTVSRNIIGFVNSGVPDIDGEAWPVAFAGASAEELENDEESPSRLSLRVFSSPFGSEAVSISKDGVAAGWAVATEAEGAVGWERLFERCEFINSARVRVESGV
ncbi:Lipase 1 [Cytospora mali]|uniref:Lipase 1 n=1 Tax=Cytospora mali TaxID=578113 RepID=A0A194WB41_CYTMA|nr:Lipase 1 [Valsa mali]